MLFFNTTSPKSIMVSIDTYFTFRVSGRFFNTDKPSSGGMFGKKYNDSTETKLCARAINYKRAHRNFRKEQILSSEASN